MKRAQALVPIEAVEHEGYFYSTIDFVPPEKKFANTQVSYMALREGWELVPDNASIVEAVVKPYTWGGRRIVMSNGRSYCSASRPDLAGTVLSHADELECQGTSYRPKKGDSDGRVLIRTLARSSTASSTESNLSNSWKRRRFTDYAIVCGSNEYPCHREVLAGVSPVFERMLNSLQYDESSSNRYEIKNAEPAVVKSMLEFMYTGSLPDSSNLVDILCLADQYALEELVRHCSTLLIDNIGPDNVATVTRALKGFKGQAKFEGLWKRVMERVKSDDKLLELVLETL
eukprot:TRINITY_DN19338_c0_g1_i1.p1 TRINITY_DN19338_c0_g1~~TRINITY_DN19338_c0_g1_i1.p1  ORF type:complete len:308 (-),score=29.33 TRINITY_DN19338_c0_g1_i1:81-941(-)